MSMSTAQRAAVEQEGSAKAAIDRTFAFLREVNRRPDILDDYPARGMVVFREVEIDGNRFDLVAIQETGAEAWIARPYRYALLGGARMLERPIRSEQVPDDRADTVLAFQAAGETREAAFAALEAPLRATVAEAIGAEPDEVG